MERHCHQQAATCFGEEKLFSLDETVSKQGQDVAVLKAASCQGTGTG